MQEYSEKMYIFTKLYCIIFRVSFCGIQCGGRLIILRKKCYTEEGEKIYTEREYSYTEEHFFKI